MDDYYTNDLKSLLREAERLQTWTSEDWLSEVGLAYCESFAEVHLCFNQICADTSFPETPEAQATPEVRNPLQPLSLPRTLDTGEESSGHPSSTVSQDETVVRQRGHKRHTVTWSPDVISKHPEMDQEIRKHLSMPDLAPLEERLNYFKSKIYKALPIASLTSKTDSAAYSSVAAHLGVFQQCVIDQGKTFMESQQWDSLVEYVFLAWSYVRATPVWDNELQNATRKHCFTALIIFCMSALKNGSFDRDALVDILNRLVKISTDTEEAKCCLILIQSQMHNIFNINV